MSLISFYRFAACTALLLSSASFRAAGQSYGLSQRPTVGAYYDNAFPPEPPPVPANWTAVEAFPGLSFLNPVGLAPVPGTNKLVVWEREGKIWVFDNNPAVTTKTLVVDLSGQCQGWDDSGLLGVALHPNFATNREMYVYYNWRGGITGGAGDLGPVLGNANARPPTNTPTRNRLSRFVLDAGYQTALASEYVVIDQKDYSVWHNGGGMFFHPQNGFLYITNGDDADPGLNSQRIDRSLFSCVIRIDVDQQGGAISHAPTRRPLGEVSPTWPRYFVPNSNPFVGQPNALEEIYAIGLRSPHRMTVDPVTGRIFIGDVGGGSREEISVLEPNDPPGLNLQWPRIEGNGGDLTQPFIGASKRPIIDYAHGGGDGSCIIGGYVYRGAAFPELSGKYVFGDNMTGKIWFLDETTTPATKMLLATLPDGPGPNSGNDYRGLGSFGVDAAGELYLCQLSSTDGRIYKLQRGGPPPGTPLPSTLSATGFFSNVPALTPDNRLLAYDLNAPFWSDRAIKKRFVAVPTGSTIGFQPTGEWAFPAGSVFVKHFDLPVSDVAATTRRLETRFLVKKADGSVYGATYKWRENQQDADLLDGALTESISIATAPIGGLTGQDIGGPAPGSMVRTGNLITITAGGEDIYGGSDQFHFAHQLRSGDFDVAVRIESVVQADLYTKTGLMVRESLDANARNVMALVFPSNAQRNNNDGGYEFQYRATVGGGTTALYPPQPQPRVSFPDTWLRMRREGNTFIAFSSSDGFTWREYSRTTLAMPTQIRFGLAVSAHTTAPTLTTAKFHVETRRQPWFYPSRQDCVSCHTSQSGGVLGLSTRQLNRNLDFPGPVTDNQIRAWNHVGYFHDAPAEATIPALEKLAHHTDTTATLEKRARSYVDANCASCHRPGGAQAFWDARFETPLAQQGIVYGAVQNTLGTPDARVVVPQDLLKSIMHRRVNVVGANQMPPLARNLVDSDGVAMLAAWIQDLQPENVNAPSGLAATAISHTRVDLTWQDQSTNEQGFAIERSLDNVTFSSVDFVSAGVTAFSDLTAEPFTTYFYRVRAFATYVFSTPSNAVTATTNVGPPAPEVRLVGQGRTISNNDLTPEAADGTDFGVAVPTAGAVTRTFTIENIGNSTLQLTGSPRVQISGADAGSFSVLAQPVATIAGAGSVAFQVRFSPQSTGTKSATVTIVSNDPDEGTTTFAVRGSGVAQDLIAWWKFNESSGTTAFDSSGTGHDGTLTVPLANWVANGHLEGAVHFTGELNQSVTIPNQASLNPSAAISITVWIYPFDWAGNRRFLQKGNGDNQYRFLAEGGALVWDIAGVGRLETGLPTINAWSHLAATYDGVAMRVFLNGVEIASQPASGAMPATGDPIYIGTKTPASVAGDHFNGYLDDLRLFGRALSAGEISTLSAQTGAVSIAASDAVAQKGASNPGAFVVTRSGSTATALPLSLALASGPGQGALGADYTLSPALAGVTIPAGQSAASIVVNALDRVQVTGPLGVTISLSEAAGYAIGASASAQVQLLDSPLNSWKISTFGSLAAAQGPAAADAADLEFDGLSILLEAALGGSPFASDSDLLPVADVELIEGQLYLTSTYIRPRPALAGVTYLGATTFDLTTGPWQPAVLVAGYPQDNLDGTETVKVRAALPVSGHQQQFIRLEISRP